MYVTLPDAEARYYTALRNRLLSLPLIARKVFNNLPPHIEAEIREIIYQTWCDEHPTEFLHLMQMAGDKTYPKVRGIIERSFAEVETPILNLYNDTRGQLPAMVEDVVFDAIEKEMQ